MKIIKDDLSGKEIKDLLEEHLSDMFATSPPEAVHALDLEKLKGKNITFFSAWENNTLMGCIALNHLSPLHAEIKSMRTVRTHRKRGIGHQLLTFIFEYAESNGYEKLSLETGTQTYFSPARRLYRQHGFEECGPFANYVENPNSCFMQRII